MCRCSNGKSVVGAGRCRQLRTRNRLPFLLVLAVLHMGLVSPVQADPAADPSDSALFVTHVKPFFTTHCIKCHGLEKKKGKITLHDLAGPEAFAGDAERWERVLEALSSQDMPPEEETQPTGAERSKIVGWINASFNAAGHTTAWSRKLLFPQHGNAIDHDTLFDGSITEPAYTPSRLWKRSPHIFDSMVQRGLALAKPRPRGRDKRLSDLKQPFTLEDKAGIKDFAAIVFADTATLGTLLRNADFLVNAYLEGAMHERHVREHGPTPVDQLPKDKNGKPIKPRFAKTPDAFKTIVLNPEAPTAEQIDTAVTQMYELVVERPPSIDDQSKHRGFIRRCIEESGDNAEGLRIGLIAVAISPEAIFRQELGQGEPDTHGRRMLGAADLAYAIAYALTDEPPDPALLEAAKSGRLRTREDVAREVGRIWDDSAIRKPRILRFFHEFFGYARAPGVFKDQSRFGGSYRAVPSKLVADADMLVNHILARDKNVLVELLTTERYFVSHSGDNEATAKEIVALDAFSAHFKDTDWKKIPYNIGKEHGQYLRSLKDFRLVETHPNGPIVKDWMNYLVQSKKHGVTPIPQRRFRSQIVAYGLKATTFDYPIEQPFVFQKDTRAGILMHPAWLIAHSLNLDNDPVRRGKWIRERLLAGSVPELPITVDASIPDEPDQPLRHRFRVTREAECWRCHVKMNPLGMTFECFDDFGRYRQVEKLHAKGKTAPLDASGALEGTGDPALDGEVSDAYDLVHRLAQSPRVRQSFVRHAFRYWMGRNEMYSDSGTLIAADKAYVDHGGSFRALVMSLLTSDSFLYRKPIESSSL